VNIKIRWLSLGTASVLLLAAGISLAQERTGQPAANSSAKQAYDLSREQTLVGTVISYSASSSTAPLGPRLILQTASGDVDVHLGDARVLAANQFTIHSGDTLRVIGEEVNFSNRTQFVARILQKGTQAIAVRTTHGFPIAPAAQQNGASGKKQEGVL